MRRVGVGLVAGAIAIAGCDSRFFGAGMTGTTGSAAADAGSSPAGNGGDAAVADTQPPHDAGRGPAGCIDPETPTPPPAIAVGACGDHLSFSPGTGPESSEGPAAFGQAYVRCGTLGPETGWHVSLSPDGSRLAALTSAGTVRVFETRTWRAIVQLVAPLGRIDAVRFSPDGTRLATVAGEMGEVSIWRAQDGTLERSFTVPAPPASEELRVAISFSSDGNRLATNIGSLIDLTAGVATDLLTGVARNVTRALNPEVPGPGGSPGAPPAHLQFMGCDRTVFFDGRAQTGDSPPSESIGVLEPGTGWSSILFGNRADALTGFAVSADGLRIAIGRSFETDGHPPGLSVYDGVTGQEIVRDPNPWGQVLGWSHDHTRLYAVTAGTVHALDGGNLHEVSHFPWPADGHFVGVSPADLLIISSGGTTSWWDPATGHAVRTLGFALAEVTFSADGTLGAGSGAPDTALFHLWREDDGAELCAPAAPGSAAAVTALATSNDGSQLALGRADGTLEVWPVDGLSAAAQLATGLGSIAAVAVSDDGSRIAALAANPTGIESPAPLQVRATATGDVLTMQMEIPWMKELALSPDGRSLAFDPRTSFDQMPGVRSVSVDTGATELEVASGTMSLIVGRYSPDSSRLAIRDNSGIEVWRIADQTREASYPTGQAAMLAVLSPDWSLITGVTTAPWGVGIWRTSDSALLLHLPIDVEAVPPGFAFGGSIVAHHDYVIHTHAMDWDALHIRDLTTGSTLRVFGATSESRPLAMGLDGFRVFTLEAPNVAVWCR